jgi:hypothetical protein
MEASMVAALRCKAIVVLALAIFMSFMIPLEPNACTTAVVTASATSTGRPLLWKNRDADNLHNQVVYCADGRYSYMGLVNTGDAAGMEIWAGMNDQGFAIMNSASYNLEVDADTKGEGLFMKLALQSCGTVGDFQALLEKTNEGGRDVSANFGVIDARGGAAYFETGRHGYRRYNADDPAIAPRGFIVRTNYSESADLAEGTGFLRRERAVDLMEGLVQRRKLSAESLLSEVSRDVANTRIGSLPTTSSRKRSAPAFAYTGDSICRYSTSAGVVFEEPPSGASPSLATIWIILGQPVAGVAVPLWVASGRVPKELAVSAEPAPLNAAIDDVRDILYPDSRGDSRHYMDLSTFHNSKDPLLPGLREIERSNFDQVEAEMSNWRNKAPSPTEMSEVGIALSRETLSQIRSLLEIRAGTAGIPASPSRKRASLPKPGVSVTDLSP